MGLHENLYFSRSVCLLMNVWGFKLAGQTAIMHGGKLKDSVNCKTKHTHTHTFVFSIYIANFCHILFIFCYIYIYIKV